MALVLACVDEIPPAPGGQCTVTQWVEVAPVIPELSLADAQAIGTTASLAMVAIGAALLVRKAI